MPWLVTGVLAVLVAGTGSAQTINDPARAIIAAFDRVNLVGLGERNHLGENELKFRLRLIRDPAFARTVNDIVIEFANSKHQSILDQFTNGEDVAAQELDEVWTVTNQKSAYAPFYQEFVDGVRAVNKNLPVEKHLRVIAGDGGGPGNRDQIAADQIRREVLDKHRKALAVFGGLHLLRHQLEFPATRWPSGNIVTILLRDDPRAKWFVIQAVDGAGLPQFVTRHGGTAERPALVSDRAALDMDAVAVGLSDYRNQFRVRDLVDALLYFGSTRPVIRPLR